MHGQININDLDMFPSSEGKEEGWDSFEFLYQCAGRLFQ